MKAKKILIALDNSPEDNYALNFSLRYFNNHDCLLVGVQLDENNLEGLEVNPSGQIEKPSGKAVTHFYDSCEANGARYSVHREDSLLVDDLHMESKFADLFVLGFNAYQKHSSNEEEGRLVKALVKSGCPMLVIPDGFDSIENIILTYDGQTSSIQGIKQFCYLFAAGVKNLDITLLTVLDDGYDFDIEAQEEKLLVEYLKQHCVNLGVYKVNGEPRETILRHVGYSPNSMVVMGASVLDPVAMIFHEESDTEKGYRAPAFITHQ